MKSISIHGIDAHRNEFEAMCGTWSVREKEEFDKAAECFEKIDPEEWK